MQEPRLLLRTNSLTASFRRIVDLGDEDKANWRLLSAQAPESTPFLDEDWTISWLGAFSPHEPVLLCVHERGKLVGLAPLMRVRERWARHPINVLRSATNNWSYRYGFLALDDREDVYTEMWRALFRDNHSDAIILDWLPEESSTLRSAVNAARNSSWSHHVIKASSSPWRPLPAPPASWDDGLKPKFKSNLRNRERRLNAAGEVTFEVIKPGDRFPDALQTFYDLEAMGWKGKRGTAILMQSQAKSFFDSYVDRASQEMWLPVLSLDGIPLAAQLIRACGRTMFLLKTTFNPEFSRYSPGQLITARAMQHGIASGMEVFDFLGVSMTWKMDWAPELRNNVQAVFCSPSATGRYAFLMRHGIKNQFKKVPGAVSLARWLRTKRNGT